MDSASTSDYSSGSGRGRAGEFIERIPGTGWLWKRFLLRFLGDPADNLLIVAAEPSLDDEQRDAGPGPGRTADHA